MRFRLNIRTTVLLFALTLLSIPYVGYEYVREMESYLRDNLETSLNDTARILASIFNNKPHLFAQSLSTAVYQGRTRNEQPINTLPATALIKIDGMLDDWTPYLDKAIYYSADDILNSRGQYNPTTLSFRHVLAKNEHHLFALFIVTDNHIVYRNTDSAHVDRNDHLQIVLFNPDTSGLSRYVIAPTMAGSTHAFELVQRDTHLAAEQDFGVKAFWAEREGGYIVEVQLPLDIIGERFGFAVADVDPPDSTIQHLIGTTLIYNTDPAGNVYMLSTEILATLAALGLPANRRIRVLDPQHRVLAEYGKLDDASPNLPWQWLYHLLLPTISDYLRTSPTYPSRFTHAPLIQQTLQGKSQLQWYTTDDSDQTVIVSAAYPIRANDTANGVVVVEETSNTLQTVQRQAINDLLQRTLIVFSLVTLGLMLFATRLSMRLRQLRNEAETAIDNSGRVTTSHVGPESNDEIGDVARSFSSILSKLRQYNDYLETMASKLSHELRTPLVVVRSSLENLEQEAIPAEAQVYMERAKQGVGRLHTLITRLSEATRLETALQNVEWEQFDLIELLQTCMAGYRAAYPQQTFNTVLPNKTLPFYGAPDLLAQMLDKLISNAIDFAAPDTAISLTLRYDKQQVEIQVHNYGATLPQEMQERLFESMVSMRKHTSSSGEPHLGLGLYIVRLIVHFHHGKVWAQNNHTENGVLFNVSLPRQGLPN